MPGTVGTPELGPGSGGGKSCKARQDCGDHEKAGWHYFNLLEPALKDHDTYAVLNYLLLPGLHHFYLGKFFRGSLNLIILLTGTSLIFFTKYVFVGTLIIFFILIVELLALFRSQVIVMNHNNHLSKEILESISKI